VQYVTNRHQNTSSVGDMLVCYNILNGAAYRGSTQRCMPCHDV